MVTANGKRYNQLILVKTLPNHVKFFGSNVSISSSQLGVYEANPMTKLFIITNDKC